MWQGDSERRLGGGMNRRQRITGVFAVVMALLVVLTGCSVPWFGPAVPHQVEAAAEIKTATITWTAPGSSFQVELDTTAQFTAPRVMTIGANRLEVAGLTGATTYFVRVASLDGTRRSDFSAVTSFTTATPTFSLAAPVLSLDSTDSQSITARWKQPAKHLRYELQLDTSEAFQQPQRRAAVTPEGSYSALKTGTLYYVRVRAVTDDGQALSPWSQVVSGKTAESLPLTVANFNVAGASTSTWTKRRPVIISLIAGEHPDVLGLQEAGYKKGHTQFAEVTHGLGSTWRVTEAGRYTTSTTRLAYNSATVRLIRKGHLRLTRDTPFGNRRFIVWGEFEQRSTGKRFVFITTHLVYQKGKKADAARTAQSRQVVSVSKKLSRGGKLPVIVTADFNTHKKRTSGNGVYRTFLNGGFADPLLRSNKLGAAENRVRADLEPYNGSHRAANMSTNTTLIDHIFVTPMRVAEWETVARLSSANHFIGVIPSDHVMLRATVYLP